MSLEISRKIFHLSGLFLAFIPLYGGEKGKIIFLFMALGISIIEFLRLKKKSWRIKIEKLFSPLMRSQEKNRPTGTFFFFWGIALSFLLFEQKCALQGLLILCVADPLASLIGSSLGTHKLGKKSWEGSLAFFLASLVILLFYHPRLEKALLIASGATLCENMSPLDDNFTIPLTTSFLCQFLEGF